MKLESVTKLYNQNTATLKKSGDGFMSEICDVIVKLLIDGQLEAIRNLDSRNMGCNTFIFINSNTKAENRIKKSLTQVSHYCFE